MLASLEARQSKRNVTDLGSVDLEDLEFQYQGDEGNVTYVNQDLQRNVIYVRVDYNLSQCQEEDSNLTLAHSGVDHFLDRLPLLDWGGFLLYTGFIINTSMDKIDTQGMSLPGKSKKPSSYDPMPVKIRTIFTPEERIELKQIIHEALDEREKS